MLYEDHMGKYYETMTEMCNAYGISLSSYKRRRKMGWGIQESLTTPITAKGPVTDHKGREYESIKEMCSAYGVDTSTYHTRIKKGLSVKDALETPKGKEIKDHKGKSYGSMYEMCKEYGVTVSAYYARIRKGMSKEEALTIPLNSLKGKMPHSGKEIKDHLGNTYDYVSEMCKEYGINRHTYYKRLDRGATLKEALTRPVKKRKGK